jgi:hypothetical protein
MWTESIPAFAIMVGALAASGLGLAGIHQLFHGGKVGLTCVVSSVIF